MTRTHAFAAALALLCGFASADITIESSRAKLIINDDATWGSLVDLATNRQCLVVDAKFPIAVITVDGKHHAATAAARDDASLALTFDGTDTQLTYTLDITDDWVRFRLDSVDGSRPTSVDLLQVPIGITKNVGTRLNAGWDDQTVVCLMAASTQTDCRVRGGKPRYLNAAAQDAPGPKLEGSAAALIVCPTPEFKPIARKASHAFGLLTNEDADGRPVKDTDLTRGSYWFLTVGEDDVDEVIEYCNKTGIKQVMMNSGSWCKSVGHYTFHESRYPNGIEGLKTVVGKFHENGVLVGMHTFVSKISKIDEYVSPLPDPRFWTDREMALAADITGAQTEIPTASDLREWAGSPVAKQTRWEGGVAKHQEVIIGDEIVQYESIGPEGEWNTFIHCKRGAWGTTAAAHPAGEAGRHYGVDGCINGYIIDQETDLMDEVADRIAGIFNYCGFDMVYFDGGEDVDRRRFNHYVSNFQSQAVSRFSKRPIIHMGTIMTHLLWHSFARSSTVDTYLNTLNGAVISGAPVEDWPTVKEHIDKSVRYMLSVRADMMPGELGWFGIWPKGKNTDGLQLDEAEYLFCKSLGYDVPVSLQTSIAQMESHPLTPEILNMVARYESLRMANAVPADTGAALQEMGANFIMLNHSDEPTFARVDEVSLVGGDHDVRAFVGPLDGGSVATLWHYARDAQVLLDLDPDDVQLFTFNGDRADLQVEDGKPLILADSTRTALVCPELSVDELRAGLEKATVRPRPTEMIFVRATDYTNMTGEMAKGTDVGVEEPDALGEVVVCAGAPDRVDPPDWYAEYTVEIPRAGRWAVWARVRYPRGGDDSFGIVLPGDEVTLSGAQVIGNCGVNEGKWHWTGRGYGTTAEPPGEPVIFKLEPGPFTFRIYPREGSGSVSGNPRIDAICLTDDATVVPTDELARERLGN